ncbi:HNH endonuclease [Flavobacterium sp. I3-2]|uniref:HNH endonuclease n=1 Tax=Flavobacterium sp. I3-2 TaxID=2748319 RepID=UPI0015A7C48A|nr:HNH endonuclease [Flavobacterium sp. I3-2]
MTLTFTKKITKSNLGKADMHHCYITIPKRQVDPNNFFGKPNGKKRTIIDKLTGIPFEFTYSQNQSKKNKEHRLSSFLTYFRLVNAQVGDILCVEKLIENVKGKQKVKFYMSIIDNDSYFDNGEDNVELYEGAKKIIIVNKYERSRKARKKCLEYHGYNCKICNILLEDKYGDIASKYIHVHHLTKVADIGKEYIINPIQDLVPICPNCHSMIHKLNPMLSIEELKSRIIENEI